MFANGLLNNSNDKKTSEVDNVYLGLPRYYQIKVTEIYTQNFAFISQTFVYTQKGWFTQGEIDARIAAFKLQYVSEHYQGSGFGYIVSYGPIRPVL